MPRLTVGTEFGSDRIQYEDHGAAGDVKGQAMTRRVPGSDEDAMEFLVEFEIQVPDGTSESDVEQRTRAEALAAAGLAADGHLLRLWRPTAAAGDPTAVGLYAADSRAELDAVLRALPLADWMQVTVVPLAPHPNDPGRDVG